MYESYFNTSDQKMDIFHHKVPMSEKYTQSNMFQASFLSLVDKDPVTILNSMEYYFIREWCSTWSEIQHTILKIKFFHKFLLILD